MRPCRLGPGGGQRQFSEQRKFQAVCPRNGGPRLSRVRGRSCRLRDDGFHFYGNNGGTGPAIEGTWARTPSGGALRRTQPPNCFPALVSINFFKSPATAHALRNAAHWPPKPWKKKSKPRKCWQLTKRCVKRRRKIFCGSKTFSTTSSKTFTTTR